MPQRAIATDGVEWLAADMSFDQDGRDSDFLRRTIFKFGQAGVCQGGAVAIVAGRTVSISGPLHFTVNGELDQIAAPANVLLGASDTWFIIAKHLTTDDTPATFYGAGSPPSKHHNVTPAIVVRNAGGGGAAVTGNGEVNIATVVTGVSTVSSITDTRIIVPTVSAGNINLGPGNTIDGMDPSVHQGLESSGAVLGHTFLTPAPDVYTGFGAALGGAAPFKLAMPFYKVDIYHFNQGTSYNPVDADFNTSPNGVGQNVRTFRWPTMYGEVWQGGYGPLWKVRMTMVVNCHDVSPTAGTAYVLAVNDAIRVRLNGSDLFTSTTDETGDHTISLPFVTGTNTLELFFSNGLDNFSFQFLTEFLRDGQIEFIPS